MLFTQGRRGKLKSAGEMEKGCRKVTTYKSQQLLCVTLKNEFPSTNLLNKTYVRFD